jgi:predicted transcriptional regulator
MSIIAGKRPEVPSEQGIQFQQLAGALRTSQLTAILGVSRESVARYRWYGAPADKQARLVAYWREQARVARSLGR